MIDKGVCDKGYSWNPSNCECECDNSCDFGEYLDYENCKYKNRLVDKLVEECDENIEETSLVKISSTIMQKIINRTYKMGVVKQIDIKNRTYYFYNDMINIKEFDSNLLKIDKKSYKDIGIYNIGYITIKKTDDYENIYGVNPLYLIIAHACGYIEEKGVNKYLVFDSTGENKEKVVYL